MDVIDCLLRKKNRLIISRRRLNFPEDTALAVFCLSPLGCKGDLVVGGVCYGFIELLKRKWARHGGRYEEKEVKRPVDAS